MSIDLLEGAARVVGADAVRAVSNEIDWIDGIAPSAIVSPSTGEEVAAALAWATRERLSVVVKGAGTKMAWGQPPSRVDICLDMQRLDKVIEHAAGDLTATVEAGARLIDVDAALLQHRQWLPLDSSHCPLATVGGVLATNDSGPLRHRYGTPSDLVLGVVIATADGLVAKSGGKVVKNVAGYDLARLLAGSHGSLAAIVSATFKLAPVPEASTTVEVSAADAAGLARVVAGMRERQLEPTTVQIRGGTTSGHLRLTLRVGFASDQSTVSQAANACIAIAESMGSQGTILNDAEFSVIGPTLPHTAVVRLSWMPGDLPGAMAAIATALHSIPWSIEGQTSVGSARVTLKGEPANLMKSVEALRRQTALGHVVVVDGSRELRRAVGVWPSDAANSLWPCLKHAWDPTGTLGAGRGPL